MKRFFYAEMTDTFGGEANYSWVRRYKIAASSMRGAAWKLSREIGAARMRMTGNFGDMRRYDLSGSCICIFLEEFEEIQHSNYDFLDL
jgi:hypothetical protein